MIMKLNGKLISKFELIVFIVINMFYNNRFKLLIQSDLIIVNVEVFDSH